MTKEEEEKELILEHLGLKFYDLWIDIDEYNALKKKSRKVLKKIGVKTTVKKGKKIDNLMYKLSTSICDNPGHIAFALVVSLTALIITIKGI